MAKRMTSIMIVLIYCLSMVAIPMAMAHEHEDHGDEGTDTEARKISGYRTVSDVTLKRGVVKTDDGKVGVKTTARDDEGNVRQVRKVIDTETGDARKEIRARNAEGDKLRYQARRDCDGEDCEVKRRAAMKRGDDVRKLHGDDLKRVRDSRRDRLAGIEHEDIGVRRVAKEKHDMAMDRLKNARDKYQKAKDRAAEHRSNFDGARDRLAACEESEEDCSELRDEVSDRAKEHLLNAAERMLGKLDQLAARIEGAESLTDEQVEDALATLDRAIAAVEEVIKEVEAATTKDELKAAASKLRNIWSNFELEIKEHAGKSVARRLVGALQKAENMEKKLNCALDSLEEPNSELEALLEEFDSHLVDARSALDRSSDSASLREAHSSLKDAHSVLKELLPALREAGASMANCRADAE